MTEIGPEIRLHDEPTTVEEETDGTVTLIFEFDGGSNADWRNLFFEAMERHLGMQHRTRARVFATHIVAQGVPRDRQEEAVRLVVSAVREANSHFGFH